MSQSYQEIPQFKLSICFVQAHLTLLSNKPLDGVFYYRHSFSRKYDIIHLCWMVMQWDRGIGQVWGRVCPMFLEDAQKKNRIGNEKGNSNKL